MQFSQVVTTMCSSSLILLRIRQALSLARMLTRPSRTKLFCSPWCSYTPGSEGRYSQKRTPAIRAPFQMFFTYLLFLLYVAINCSLQKFLMDKCALWRLTH